MNRHLNSTNATKCSAVTTFKSVKYFTVHKCLLSCSFTLHFVKKIDEKLFQRDNSMKLSVFTKQLNITEIISTTQGCDNVEDEALSPG